MFLKTKMRFVIFFLMCFIAGTCFAQCYSRAQIEAFKKTIKIKPSIIDKSGFYTGKGEIIRPVIKAYGQTYLLRAHGKNYKNCVVDSQFHVEYVPSQIGYDISADGKYKISIKPKDINFSLNTKRKTFRPIITILGGMKEKFINPVFFSKNKISISVKKILIKDMWTIQLSFKIHNETDNFITINKMGFYVDNNYIKLPLYNNLLKLINNDIARYSRSPVMPFKQKYIKIPPHLYSKVINVDLSDDDNNDATRKMIDLFLQPVTKLSYQTKKLKLGIAVQYTANNNRYSMYNAKNVFLWRDVND